MACQPPQTQAQQASLTSGMMAHSQFNHATGHSTGASEKIRQFFTSDKMLQQVADLYKQDFDAFGYQRLTLADLHGTPTDL